MNKTIKTTCCVRRNRFGIQLFVLAIACLLSSAASSLAVTNVDLSTYVRVGRFDLPEPTRTTPPDSTNLLGQEASGVAFNRDTGTLFIVADGGTSVLQVTTNGVFVDTMTMASGGSPQGTEFYDPEGITYIGSNQFVFTEERDRRVVLFTYAAGTVLTRTNSKTVTLGTFVPNIGLEGLSYDPLTAGFILVKESSPLGIFQTTIDFDAGTASNGSPTNENSTNLFDPALTGMVDFGDVFSLANVTSLTNQPDSTNLLVLSQESGKIVNIDRTGNILSTLTIMTDFGNPLDVPSQQHEGLTMDDNGILYVVSENGGGDFDHPQLWVYAPATLPNQAASSVVLTNIVSSIAENTSTATPIKVADIFVFDDGLGTNVLTVSGTDASFFEITGSALFIKASTVLDFETKTNYSLVVNVDDASVGGNPDASTNYSLTVTDQGEVGPPPTLVITEVAPWSSGNSPVAADWFEVLNNGTNTVNITGWRVDDSSASFAVALLLTGVTNIAPGECVIFLETANLTTARAAFLSNWFGANATTNLQIGAYTGSGIGLSTGGDAVNLYDTNGTVQASVSFGPSPAGPTFATFDNAISLNNTNITRLSKFRVYGALYAANSPTEIGSPGNIGRLIISEVAPWSSGNSPVGVDWFEVINTTPFAVDITGWKVDDSSAAIGLALALTGITNIAPGEAVIFMETANFTNTRAAFLSNWFGASPPTNLQIGAYTGTGIGLSTGGDAVNLFDTNGTIRASVTFGASPLGPTFQTFENSFGLHNTMISLLSVVGVHSATVAVNDTNEVGSPGTGGKIVISEVAPWSSGNSPVAADWFELSNTGSTAVDISGWRVDDSSQSFAAALPLTGITNIAPGESVIFIEHTNLTNARTTFLSNWFGTIPQSNLQIGTYTGSGIGLSTGGDAVNIYNSNGVLQAFVSFSNSPAGPVFATFDNGSGLNNASISQLSVVGANGAFVAVNDANEIGSPGIMTVPEIAFTRSGTNATFRWTVDYTGYRLEESSTPGVAASWGSVAQSVAVTNGLNSVNLPMTNASSFFRLRRP